MASLSDEEIVVRLTEEGTPLDAYFLLGEPGRQLVALWHPSNGVMVCMIDGGRVASAYKRFLSKRGVRQFQSAGDVYEVARRERWPNWEKFENA